MSSEIAVPQEFGLQVSRDPKAVLAEAHRAAAALQQVIEAIPKEKKVVMGGEQYIEFDHWQLIGRFYGCSVRVDSTEPVQVGNATGFQARASVLDRDGRVISSADAMCLNDEDKWSSRPKYEWHYVKKSGGLSAEDPGKDEIVWDGKKPRKERVRVGDVQVPFNQLRSMAQTRACAKALRNVFSWVVVLAGYAPTPAEEMTGDEVVDERTPIKPPQEKPKSESQETADCETKEIVVSRIESKQVKNKDGKPFDVLIIHAEDGWKGEIMGFLPDAKVLQASEKSGETVLVGFVFDPKYGNKIKGAKPVGGDAQED